MRKRSNTTKLILTMLAVGLFFMTGIATTALAGGGTSPKDTPPGDDNYPDDSIYKTTFQSHTLVVKMYPQFSAGDITGNVKIEKIEESLTHSNTYLVDIIGGADPETMAAELAGQSGIAYAHPNYILDALHPVQGSIPFSDEVRIGSFEGQQAVSMTNLVAAHTDATGNQITVAVIDGGVEFSHPALEGTAVSGWDYIGMDNDAFDEPGGDASGHGTFVAGLIHLVAPNAVILAYRVMDPSGSGDGFTLAQAIEQAVDDGCDVINLSVVLTGQHLAVQDAINYATTRGVIVVAAAGNDATDTPAYPAAESNAIAVAAVDTLMEAASFTNYGSYIDVCAPGVKTYSAYQGDLFAWWDGTSFAAPFVAGEAALLRQDYPNLLVAQIKGKILNSAHSVDAENPELSGMLGAGLIDPSAALQVSGGNSEAASVIPDTLFFTHILGADYFAAPTQSALLLSSNAPADYAIQLVETTDTFVSYNAGGVTNDSIYVSMYPGSLTEGEYFNKIRIDVDGVADPVYLVAVLNVIPQPPVENEAHFLQSEMTLNAAETDPPINCRASLTSSNLPADFTVEVAGGAGSFITLLTTSGTTASGVEFTVDPAKVSGPGLYVDTIIATVADVAVPARLPVSLSIETSGHSGGPVQISPAILDFTAVEGSTNAQTNCALLFVPFENPTQYSGYVKDGGLFTTLLSDSGLIPDSVCVEVDPTGLAIGSYTDSLFFTVDNYADPAALEVNLTIVAADTTSGPNDSTIVPGDSTYIPGDSTYNPGDTTTIPGDSTYIPPDDSTYTPGDTTTVPGDSTYIPPDDSTYNPGDTTTIPGDSTYIPGDSTYNPGDTATVPGDSTEVPYDVVLVGPSDLYFFAYEGSTELLDKCVLLYHSEGANLPYTGYVQEGGQIAELLSPSGQTPDTICIQVDPTGLFPGLYTDSVYFFVEGYDPALLTVNLSVNGGGDSVSQSGTLSQNYPNPFNPTTTISFTLNTTAHVTLSIYNVLGRKVTTLVNDNLETGDHSVQWDASNAASGIYFYRLNIAGQIETKKMVLLR